MTFGILLKFKLYRRDWCLLYLYEANITKIYAKRGLNGDEKHQYTLSTLVVCVDMLTEVDSEERAFSLNG